MMATTFWSVDGRPMSAAQFIERLFGELPEFFKNEDELRDIWSRPGTRKALLESLSEKGYGGEELAAIRKMIDAEKSDLFDVLAYIAFALAPITREERVISRRADIFARYDGKLQAFLDFVLSQYVKQGVEELDEDKLGKLLELKYQAFAMPPLRSVACRLSAIRSSVSSTIYMSSVDRSKLSNMVQTTMIGQVRHRLAVAGHVDVQRAVVLRVVLGICEKIIEIVAPVAVHLAVLPASLHGVEIVADVLFKLADAGGVQACGVAGQVLALAPVRGGHQVCMVEGQRAAPAGFVQNGF